MLQKNVWQNLHEGTIPDIFATFCAKMYCPPTLCLGLFKIILSSYTPLVVSAKTCYFFQSRVSQLIYDPEE